MHRRQQGKRVARAQEVSTEPAGKPRALEVLPVRLIDVPRS